MCDEAWLIGRNQDASKETFVATEILLFDFVLFIGGLFQNSKKLASFSICLISARIMTICRDYR